MNMVKHIQMLLDELCIRCPKSLHKKQRRNGTQCALVDLCFVTGISV